MDEHDETLDDEAILDEEEAPKARGLSSLKEAVAKMNHGPADLLCIDVDVDSMAAVRMKRTPKGAVITAAGFLPGLGSLRDEDGELDRPEIAVDLRARQVSMCVQAELAVIKLLNFPGSFEDVSDEQILTSMGVEDTQSNRVGYKVISEGHGRTESRVLAVSMPEEHALEALELFPSGLPAPYGLEISGLAGMTAFQYAKGGAHQGEAVGVIDFGSSITHLVYFARGELVLVRKFAFGTETLVSALETQLGVDRETALSTLTTSSIDLSEQIDEVIAPFTKQLIISRDFVERKYNCPISCIYFTGGITGHHSWNDPLQRALGIDLELWTPFDAVDVAPNVLTEEISSRASQFAGAIGIGLGTFEET